MKDGIDLDKSLDGIGAAKIGAGSGCSPEEGWGFNQVQIQTQRSK